MLSPPLSSFSLPRRPARLRWSSFSCLDPGLKRTLRPWPIVDGPHGQPVKKPLLFWRSSSGFWNEIKGKGEMGVHSAKRKKSSRYFSVCVCTRTNHTVHPVQQAVWFFFYQMMHRWAQFSLRPSLAQKYLAVLR